MRIYLVKPHWDRGHRGAGRIDVLEFVPFADPDRKVPFPIVNDNSDDRLLTGDDFDIESVQRAADGSFWVGDEFGPFLLHFSAQGHLLRAPVQFPLGQSPQNPLLGHNTPNTQRSGGFEALGQSPRGRYLYPVVEKALVNDPDRRRRVISEFDTRDERYTGRTWAYRVDTDLNLVADAQRVGGQMLILERDEFDGAAAVTKRVYRVDLDRSDHDGYLVKTLVADLLKINNPHPRGRLLIGNDNN